MKKIVTAVVASLGVLVAGCSCTPNNQYPQQQYDSAPYQQTYQQAPSSGHGDAIVAGVAGLAAGHYLGKRSARKNNYYGYRGYSRPSRTVYTSRPSYRSTFSSPSRSSSRGSYRSRR
jgi:hypothetical protein